MAARHRRRRPALLFTVPLLAAGGVAVASAQLAAGTGPDPAALSPALAPAAATSTPTTGIPAPAAAKVVKGVVTFRAGILPPGSTAGFLLDGAERVTKTDRSAPYEFRVDTRQLPDGAYALVVKTWQKGTKARTTRSRVTIANAAPVTTATTGASNTKPPAPTTTTTTTKAPPTTSPATTTTRPPSSTTTRPATTTTSPPGGTGGGYEAEVVSLTNTERSKAGCPALKVNAILAGVAERHSADMAAKNYFSHTGADGRSPFQRMSQAGYSYSAAAENIAAGYRSPAAVMAGWMNSSGHRANILNCRLTEIGVGYVTGGSYSTYWTQNFGTPR